VCEVGLEDQVPSTVSLFTLLVMFCSCSWHEINSNQVSGFRFRNLGRLVIIMLQFGPLKRADEGVGATSVELVTICESQSSPRTSDALEPMKPGAFGSETLQVCIPMFTVGYLGETPR
jgi:hypothetical protein